VWIERRLEYIDQVIAETHALGDLNVSGRGVGSTACRRQVERFLTGLPDLKFIVDDTISKGDKLVVYWTITGTHRGEFLECRRRTARHIQRYHHQSDRRRKDSGIYSDLGRAGSHETVRN
jgi:predicted ester cyclase